MTGVVAVSLVGEIIGFAYAKGSFRGAHSVVGAAMVVLTLPQVQLWSGP